jgi:predicted nucleotidyltransferase
MVEIGQAQMTKTKDLLGPGREKPEPSTPNPCIDLQEYIMYMEKRKLRRSMDSRIFHVLVVQAFHQSSSRENNNFIHVYLKQDMGHAKVLQTSHAYLYPWI